MSWHAGDFHFFLQIAPFHNKNTTHIRLDVFGGKMEMFILAAFDLSQSKKWSWQKNTTGDRRGSGSPRGWLGTPVGCGVRVGPVASPVARCDEPEERGGSAAPGYHPALLPGQPRGPGLQQRSPDELRWAEGGKAVCEKSHLQGTCGRNHAFFFFFSPLNSLVSGVSGCQWGYSMQGAVHALGLAGLRRAKQSKAEPSRAEPSVLSPLIHSLSLGAVVASRELRQRNFPHPLPPSVCLPWQQHSALVTNRCPHSSSSKALFILLASMPW